MSDKGDRSIVEWCDGVVETVWCGGGNFVVVRWRVGEHGEASKDFLIGFLL